MRRLGDCLLDTLPARTSGSLCWRHTDAVGHILNPANHGDPQADIPASIPVMWAAVDMVPGHGTTVRRAPGYASTPPTSMDKLVMRDDRSRLDPTVWYPAGPTGLPDWTRAHVEDADPPRAVRNALESLADALIEDLAPAGPDLPDGRYLSDLSVAGLCAWLHTHLDHLTARPDADEIYDDLTELSDQLRYAVVDHKMPPAGRCIELVRDPVTRTYRECAAWLYLPPPVPDPVEQAPEQAQRAEVLSCRRCHRRYSWLDLIRLRLAQPA